MLAICEGDHRGFVLFREVQKHDLPTFQQETGILCTCSCVSVTRIMVMTAQVNGTS